MIPSRFFHTIWCIAKKDLQVWLRHPLQILSTLLVPLSYSLVVFVGAQAIGRNPVAIVNEDQGQVGSQLVHAMVTADVFRANVTSASQAQALYDTLQVAAIITIPPDLSRRVQAHEVAPIQVRINNYNLDLTNGIRRAISEAITTYYQGFGRASPILVTIAEHRLRARDVDLLQYSMLPVVILMVTVNGIITTGMAATTEWEKRTVKELLLAPCGRLTLLVGKVLAGFLGTFALALGMLIFGAALNLTRPEGFCWFSAVVVIALGSLCSAGVGIAVGTSFQRKQPVSYAATIVAVEMFALAGGLGDIFLEPEWLQMIARFDPLTYAIHSLQQAVFYNSLDGFLRDALVLAATSVLAITLGSLAMRRRIVLR